MLISSLVDVLNCYRVIAVFSTVIERSSANSKYIRRNIRRQQQTIGLLHLPIPLVVQNFASTLQQRYVSVSPLRTETVHNISDKE